LPRQARLDSLGTLHHVMLRGIEGRLIVEGKYDRSDFVRRMGDLAQETSTKIFAWVLMDNHAHILLKSGPDGLSTYMRRFLTGYAISYNIRHRRRGHLFQNRYKSIVCDEDTYFTELVRYIHLNPIRAGIVKNMSGLDRYSWSGHRIVMGKRKLEWQDCKYVRSYFGSTIKEAQKNYRAYVAKGIADGKREDLIGGGLVRTLGGWSQVLSARKRGEDVLTDQRILGSNGFVERVIDESEKLYKHQVSIKNEKIEAEKYIKSECENEEISLAALKGGSRRGIIPELRARMVGILINRYGLSLAETGRQLGVTTSAISKIISRQKGLV